jgi:hypothetical protein
MEKSQTWMGNTRDSLLAQASSNTTNLSATSLSTQGQVKGPIAFTWLTMGMLLATLATSAVQHPARTSNTESSHKTLWQKYLNFSALRSAAVESFAALLVYGQLGQQQQAVQVVVGIGVDCTL